MRRGRASSEAGAEGRWLMRGCGWYLSGGLRVPGARRGAAAERRGSPAREAGCLCLTLGGGRRDPVRSPGPCTGLERVPVVDRPVEELLLGGRRVGAVVGGTISRSALPSRG